MLIASKVAIVTGGASGRGRATAERFHAAGAKVAIVDLNDDAATELAQALNGECIRLDCAICMPPK